MDALDLLAREDEFKKLNKQLEKKTESLMKEIEHVMQKQDFFSEFSHNISLSPAHSYTKKHCCDNKLSTPERTPTKRNLKTSKNSPKQQPTTEIGRSENLHEDCAKNFTNERATVENVCKFLASKVKLMQEQIDKLQAAINKKASQCEAHLTKHAELESERMGLLNSANNLRATSADLKAKWMTVQKKLEEKERLYKEQRSETDRLTSEVKRLRSKNAGVEARCASQEEAITTLKHQLDTSKRSEKEFRDSSRSLSASHETAISRLESRIKCLTTNTDRQAALIDNLRKQIALLSTEGALKALEKEYCKFLTEDF